MFIYDGGFCFQLFDWEKRGSLSAQQLSGLMGALLGVPQQDTAALYAEACGGGSLTEGKSLAYRLLRAAMTSTIME